MLEQSYISRLSPTLNSNKAFITDEERKAYKKASRNSSEYKSVQKAYQKTSKHKAYQKTANQKPEVKAMKKAYKKTQKYKDYQKEYDQSKTNIRSCICGTNYNYGKISTRNGHYRSQKHQKHVALIFAKLRGE